MTKLTVNEVADLLGCSSLPSEVDYRITECATKGVAAIEIVKFVQNLSTSFMT
jgi:hypothetical protein